MKQNEILQLKLSQVLPDEGQPRKYFNAEKIKTLKNSIKQYGIRQPLLVMDMGSGKYLILEGERRFRAATELELKEVPVIIEPAKSATERLLYQFNIQEQHESWTPVEKAMVLVKLAQNMKLELPAVVKLLNVTESEGRRYAAFAEIMDKDAWVRNEIPLDFAQAINSLRANAKKLTEGILEKDFAPEDGKKMEAKLMKLIKRGVIVKRNEITRLRDAFRKEPKAIRKFLDNADSTPLSLFAETRARGAYHLRNIVVSSRWIQGHVARYLEAKDVKPTHEEIVTMKKTVEDLKMMMAQG